MPNTMPNRESRLKIKLIASDIDGTLLDSDHKLPLLTQEGLLKISLVRTDITFMLATGKTLFASRDLMDKLHFLNNAFGVFLNGAIVVKRIIEGQVDNGSSTATTSATTTITTTPQPNTTITTTATTTTTTTTTGSDAPYCNTTSIPGYIVHQEQRISPLTASWFLEKCIKDDITIALYSYDSIFTPFDYTPKHGPFFEYVHSFHEPTIQTTTHLVRDVKDGSLVIHKLMLLVEPFKRDALMDELIESVGFPKDVSLLPTMPEMLEVMLKGVSKACAIKFVCESMGVGMGNVMSFGDGSNDYEMIQETGWGVAMKNGIESLKDIANDVCGSNDASGVPEYVMKYLEIE